MASELHELRLRDHLQRQRGRLDEAKPGMTAEKCRDQYHSLLNSVVRRQCERVASASGGVLCLSTLLTREVSDGDWQA